MTLNDSSRVWSAQAVRDWEVREKIALPRLFRRLYQFLWSGGRFCEGLFKFWSLEEVARAKENPKMTLCKLVGVNASLDNEAVWQHLLESEMHGVRSSSIKYMLKTKRTNIQNFVAFASASSVGVYDQNVTLFFNEKPHLGPKPVIPSDPYSYKLWLEYEHEMAAFWLHDDPSGNGTCVNVLSVCRKTQFSGGWHNWSFCQLPECLFTWLQFIVAGSDCQSFGAFDQP